MKTGILIINLGTPDAPTPRSVGRYLREFLGDERVIDIPWLGRKILVNGIIAPTRKYKSAREYKKVWTDNGSPLLLHAVALKEKLQERFKGEDTTVEMAMRYQSPSMKSVLDKMNKDNYDRILVLPLYPHYASASTGSTIQKAMELISKWYVIPEIQIISQFWEDEGYLGSFEKRAGEFDLNAYDKILFSYHGLPERHVDKVYEDRKCSNHSCEDEINEENKFCYKATCFATTRALAKRLNIPEEKYTVCFQSRLDKKWLRPFADEVIEELGKEGVKKLLVFSPAFVADCLETTVEIGREYLEIFEENGGQTLDLVPSLNSEDFWVSGLERMIRKKLIL
ncbi:MAG: ferrochelatase [Flavobacteriales bacterium]|jgi:ferrochelatase